MDESNFIEKSKYAKAGKWSTRKLQKALDEEAHGVAATKSTITKFESEMNELLATCSELIGTKINTENMSDYIGKIQNNVTLVQLKTHEAEIQQFVNRLTQTRQRLQDHSISKSHLLDLLKRKHN